MRELAKLKLIGRPVIAGRDSWFAIRPLPRLVHVYHDFKLLVMLQFPEDPRFLLFVPPQEDTSGVREIKGSVGDPGISALLVISSDGSLWWISCIDTCSQLERVSKRLKKDGSMEIKESTKKVSEHECDVCMDTESYSADDVYAEFEAELHASRKMHASCKVLESRGSRRPSLKVQLQCVQPEALIAKFPGASIAAVGPDALIALVGSSRRLPILLDGSNLSPANVSSTEGLSSSDDHMSTVKAKATCLLFATMKSNEQRCLWGGVCLSPRFFNAFGQSFVGARPKHLLLQGDVAGLVHIFPINYPSQISTSTILCDLQEPIMNLIAAPLEKDHNALFVISSRGRLIAVSISGCESASSPSLSSISKLSCLKLFCIELTSGFDVYEWRIGVPVVSPTLYGFQYLCFGSALNLCLINVLDIVTDAKAHHLPSSSASMGMFTEKTGMKNFPVWKTLPLGDVVIALFGHGPSSHSMTGSLVALTSRGRLIALDDPVHNMKTSYIGCGNAKDASKSWESRGKNTTHDNVVVLLDKISVVESCTEDLQSFIKSMDCVLSELAFALRLTYDVLSCPMRDMIRGPNQFFAGCLIKGLHCHLEVNSVVHAVPTNRLCFYPSPSRSAFNSYHRFLNISNFELNLKVTLHNCSPYPVSSYWVLCLEVQNLEETGSKRTLFYSSIINDGYGLAVGASSMVVFRVPCACRILTPLKVSVFMCHINENYGAMIQAMLTPNIEGFIDTEKNSCENHEVPWVACLLMARYRLDILSLLRPSQKLQHSLDLCPSFLTKNVRGNLAETPDESSNRLRPFLGKFQLSCPRQSDYSSWTVVEKWKDIHLDDLVTRCALSRNGEELTGTDLHGNSVLLTLDNKLRGREGEVLCKQIEVSSTSSLTGFLAREAVLWRLKRSLRDQGIIGPNRSDALQNVEGDRSFLVQIQEKLRVIAQDAHNIERLWLANSFEFADADFIDDRTGQAYRLCKLLLETYVTLRENDVSNPLC